MCEILRLFFLYRTVKASLKRPPPPGSLKIFKSKNCFLGLAMVLLTETRELWKTFFNPSWFREMYQNYLSRQLLLNSCLIFLWTKVSHGMAIKFVSGYMIVMMYNLLTTIGLTASPRFETLWKSKKWNFAQKSDQSLIFDNIQFWPCKNVSWPFWPFLALMFHLFSVHIPIP